MSKIDLDKYYTNKDLAKYCTEKMASFTGVVGVTCIEPSAGNGSFIQPIQDTYSEHLFMDIEPEHNLVHKQDYLEYECDIDNKVVVLGNPPFGRTNSLVVKFFKRSIKFADYIGFILPISQLGNTKQLYEFDLIHSEDLGVKEYSGVMLHCCFNIYKRPESGKLNKKVKIEVDGLNVIECRRDKEGKYLKKVKDGYFLSICSWGNGSLGKTPEYVGQYAMELYFYSEDDTIKDIVSNIDWWNEISCISAKKLPKGLALEIINNKLNCCQEDKGEFDE